jgi:uncharacterized protein (DUF488 family)
MPEVVYTIGHGNLSFMRFIALVQGNNITHLIDIRSIPYSRKAPWSNKSRLPQLLRPLGIRYTYLGHKFNDNNQTYKHARPPTEHDPTESYNEAITTILLAATKRQLALLCAESDPAHCFRQHVLAQTMLVQNVKVVHILKNGSLKDAWREPTSPKQAELF